MSARAAAAIAIALMAAAVAPPAAPAEERTVEIAGEGGVPLAGTLSLPALADVAKVPALVLIQGSGPTDRDGNQKPRIVPNLLRDVAERLATCGVASVRYDKRGMHANAKSLPASRDDWAAFFRWENFVGDAVAAYRFLAGQPTIDGGRVGIFGHSEGALVALSVAEATRAERPPAALVLASAPGRPFAAVVHDQLERALRRQKAKPDAARIVLEASDEIVRAVRLTGEVPEEVPDGLRTLYPSYIGPFLAAVLALDPAGLAGRYPGPVLVLAGARDLQISPRDDAEALARALAARAGDRHRLMVAPGLGHNLGPLRGENDPGLAGPLDRGLADTMCGWLATALPSD